MAEQKCTIKISLSTASVAGDPIDIEFSLGVAPTTSQAIGLIVAMQEAARNTAQLMTSPSASKRPRVPEPEPEAKDETYGGIVKPAFGEACPHPGCGRTYVTSCRCLLSDRHCAANHQWHYHGDKVVIGPSPHAGTDGNNFVCPLC